MKNIKKKIAIIGAGISGLYLAWKTTKKFDAVKLVKVASEVLGGKGGGGRKDFAQAGGTNKDRIDEAFKKLSEKIN